MVAGTVKIKKKICASRIVPAFKLQKESAKKNECAIDGEEFVFLFALRALCLRLSFQRKARKKK